MTRCLHVDKWFHTWIFYTSFIIQIPVRTLKLTFIQAENQIWTLIKTIYTLEMFLYITHCDMTLPTPLSEADLYSFIENPVAGAISLANWISNAFAFIASKNRLRCLFYNTQGLGCLKRNTLRPVNCEVSAQIRERVVHKQHTHC